MALEGRSLVAAVVGAGLAAEIVGLLVLFGLDPPPAPPKPKEPPPVEASMATLKYSPQIYRAMIEGDAKSYGAPPISVEELGRPFPYFEEFRGRRRLKNRGVFESAHLRIALEVRKEQASVEGQSYSADHLALRIENKTPLFLAYRVQTDIADKRKCAQKGDTPHNEISLGPGEVAYRTECLHRSEEAIDLVRVEVMEMPPLAAYYVARLPPPLVLYEPRTSAGHLSPKGRQCPQNFSWREIKDGDQKGEFGWKDVMDFYGRHNCDEYVFFRAYRYRTDPKAPLPAKGTE